MLGRAFNEFSHEMLPERYEVQKQLGKTTGRQTLLARNKETQELVIIKLLFIDSNFSWEQLKLFEREANILKTLSHPAIPHYIDYFELNSPHQGFALVQSYIQAQSLQEQLEAGRIFTESEVRQIAKTILEVLSDLHKHQPPVIHRDLKPSNILLSNRSGHSIGQIHLIDFGSVQTQNFREDGAITIVGTYGYIPPEQFGGRTVPASDLYSLGATLITLVTGVHPADLPQKEGRIQFEQATTLSPAMSRWLKAMTEPSLERRFSSTNEAIQALEQRGQVEVVPRQPLGSRVLLKKDAEALEILVPPAGFSFEIVRTFLFAIAWNYFLFNFLRGGSLFFILFLLPFWASGIMMISSVLFAFFRSTRLRINQRHISLTYEMFGLKYNHPRPALSQDISKLEYTKLSFVKDSDGDRVKVPPKIIVWVGTKEYEIGSQTPLTTPELEWLVQELSNYLSLPITQR